MDAPSPTAWRARLAPILASPQVGELQGIMRRYDAAGGALLASGLAYSALFAIVPTIIVLLGLVGVVVADPIDRANVTETLSTVAPPLRGLVSASLEQLTTEAASISIVGLIGFAWGASRFLVALESALGRVLSGDRPRSLVGRNLIGLASVVVLLGAVVGGMLFAGLGSFVASFAEAVAPGRTVSSLVEVSFGIAGAAITVLALAVVYRFLPAGAPSWRAILVPSIGVAIVLALITRLFVFLAPRLIGAAAFLGTLATVFAALAWLGLAFQAILIGAAWIRVRSDREQVLREDSGQEG
ncbi:MAG: YihY/virulence factor BrkB family protein [Chloroflexota bacterium]